MSTRQRLVYKPNPIKNYVYHTLADTKKAEEVLEFKAKIALREGVKRPVDHYEQAGMTWHEPGFGPSSKLGRRRIRSRSSLVKALKVDQVED